MHIHPVDSLVVCCQGSVRSTGDLEKVLEEGDIIIIPAGYRHGFVGAGEVGFWGLSIQFESLALYEDLESPLVTFVDADGNDPGRDSLDAVTLLLQKNDHYRSTFSNHKIFESFLDGEIASSTRQARFLNLLHVWSSVFQKLLFCRAAFTDNPKFARLARAHLRDEFGHDESLELNRPDFKPIWDPILESVSQWFITRMLSSDDAEKTVLIHLVLESAASIFYHRYSDAMSRPGVKLGEHFSMHADEADLKHVKMGLEVLRQFPLKDHGPLLEIQRRGWVMFNALFDRIHELTFTIEEKDGLRVGEVPSNS